MPGKFRSFVKSIKLKKLLLFNSNKILKVIDNAKMSKFTVHLVNVIKLLSMKHVRSKVIKLQIFSVFKAITHFGDSVNENLENKVAKYWSRKPIEDVINEADDLFYQENI